MIPFVVDDGGRAKAGYKGDTRDCVARAVAIASGLSYGEVYKTFNRLAKEHERGKKRSSARTGVYTSKKWFKDYMASLGFEWVATSGIGKGVSAHLDPSELPSGRLVVSIRNHFTSVIDGELHDTYDCSKTHWTDVYGVSHKGVRSVYGYYRLVGEVHSANPPSPKANKVTVTPKRKATEMAAEMGATISGGGHELELIAPDGYHWGASGTHYLNSSGWRDALDLMKYGVEPCTEKTCELWVSGEGRCENDVRNMA